MNSIEILHFAAKLTLINMAYFFYMNLFVSSISTLLVCSPCATSLKVAVRNSTNLLLGIQNNPCLISQIVLNFFFSKEEKRVV